MNQKYEPKSLEGEPLIFYNYKEPLKPTGNGFGYMGCILSNKEETKIQCHVCGLMFEGLAMHARQAHGLSSREYKEKFQLAYTTALVSESRRIILKTKTIEWLNSMSPEKPKQYREMGHRSLREGRRRQPLITLETKNKRGTCPDQLLHKIRVVSEAIGHSPSKDEFIDYYKSQKFIHIIYKTFGSWANAKELAGAQVLSSYFKKGDSKPSLRRKPYTSDELIELMKIFYEENRKPPTETDCRRGLLPDSQIFRKVFGSMARARKAAGIHDQVGRWVKH